MSLVKDIMEAALAMRYQETVGCLQAQCSMEADIADLSGGERVWVLWQGGLSRATYLGKVQDDDLCGCQITEPDNSVPGLIVAVPRRQVFLWPMTMNSQPGGQA